MAPFANSVEQLRAELARLDVLLQRELTITRSQAPADAEGELRGLVITEGEIEALARQPNYLDARWRPQSEPSSVLQQLDDRAAALRSEIDARIVESREAGVTPALVVLAERTGLSRAEVDVLLLAVAPALEPRYETLYAYIQDDVTRKRPTVDLALNLISRTAQEKMAARRFVAPDAPLRANRLITLADDPLDRHATLLRQTVKVEEGVVSALVDRWAPSATVADLIAPGDDIRLDVDPGACRELEALARRLPSVSGLAIVRLVGDDEPVREAAEWLAARLGRPLLIADTGSLERSPDQLPAVRQDAILGGCMLALTAHAADDAERARQEEARRRLWQDLRTFDGAVLLLGAPGAFRQLPQGAALWHVDVPRPDFARRRDRWREAVGPGVPAEAAGRLADSFRFGRAGIEATVGLARSLAEVRHPEAPAPALPDVLDAGRILTAPELRRFAVHIEPRYTWSDIVLPRDKAEQLRRIANWKRLRHDVFESWGFGAKLSRGKGLNVLFSGPSGTGKTMAAEVLASDLSLDLFQIDLSSVVSKYVGETEEHLNAIFQEAADTQSLLFFDEADALFGKRTEVKDAHDRYANIEVNFLLQRIEQFDGIVILATNMRRNLDDAFLRRLTDVLEFPFPDEPLRERIWRGHFPRDDIRDTDVDFAFLARQFKLTGGNIKNIVLDAAFRASAERRRIGMRHILLATRAELLKEGRLPTRSEFAEYYELVQPESPRVKLVGR